MKSTRVILLFALAACHAVAAADGPARGNPAAREATGAREESLAADKEAADEPKRARAVTPILQDAITTADRLDKAGDTAGCVQTYEKAAKDLLAEKNLREYHRHELRRLQGLPASGPNARALLLHQGFKDMLSDLNYTFAVEDAFPEGFPAPGLVGDVLVKEYPACRAARAAGNNPFMTVFMFINQNAINMTAPVAMTVDNQLQVKDMAFFFQQPTLGKVGQHGAVAVVDLPAMTVLSVGMRGARNDEMLARAKAVLAATLAAQGVAPTGECRILGYHGPHVPLAQQYWELQIPVKP